MRTYAYLRASTTEQNATRALSDLEDFATSHGLTIAASFIENVSGASLQRPELFRLLTVAQAGDVLLVEQIDRLSRLDAGDWEKLRGIIQSKGIRIVALDLPTSYLQLQSGNDEFMRSMMNAINGMMLDMLAAIARKDYTDRRRRQFQGIEKAKELGLYKGRQPDLEKHEHIRTLIAQGNSQRKVAKMLQCAVGTVRNALSVGKSEG
ncbi:TPA: recombinase family protein [Yersinia enterocolitica]|uniref:recombinase family protein n=1 Tax=Yersinia enterocolitica TaxID=630 RepID=UPI0032FC65A7|nr:recombinase family protein [Yersinia enterocolitica]